MMIEKNEQFQKGLDLLETSNDSFFLTGKAGTGKSTLLSYFLQTTKKNVVVLAPTGVAALNVKGETIHSFFKFSPGITVEKAKSKGKKIKKKSVFHSIDMMVIDEISMVRADLLDCMDVFLKEALKNKTSFGGIRVVFIGDLYQLPPVVKGEEKKYFSEVYESPYFFSAKVMKEKNLSFLELEKIYRQKDQKFIEMLNLIRKNKLTDEDLSFFNQKVDPDCKDKDEGYIYLTSTNQAADEINREKLLQLEGNFFSFSAKIEGDFELSMAPTDKDLQLKKGAQVMFLTNHPQGFWVNGTVGKVFSIDASDIVVEKQDGEKVVVEKYPWTIYQYVFDEKKEKIFQEEVGSFLQYPLKLAWGITIHKSQGKTFEKVILDIGRGMFAHGQAYVALSRCKTWEGLILKVPLQRSHVMTDFRVVQFLTTWQYERAEKECSKEDKVSLLEKAIQEKKHIEIVYLKTDDEKTKRKILPLYVGSLTYQNKTYLGVEAFCLKRNEKRVFRVDRILEIFSVTEEIKT